MLYMSQKLKLLFLDDMEVRHELLKRWMPSADRCYSYDEAVHLLTVKQYDILSLDHDLSLSDTLCTPGVNNREHTGTDLANFIAKKGIPAELVILHTHNPMGADCMASIFSGCRLIKAVWKKPFGFEPDLYCRLEAR